MSLDEIPSPPPAPTALTDARGRYRLPSAAGLARLQITKPGFTAAERFAQVVAGARVPPLDARLTPLDPNATVITGILGGTADEYADLVPAVGANTSLTVDAANVVLTFSADPPPNSQVGLGATVVYTIAVQNTGTVTVPGISVTSTAPAGMVFVSSEPAPDSSAGLHGRAEPLDVFCRRRGDPGPVDACWTWAWGAR